MTADEVGSSSEWSKEQDKAFENALAIHPEDASDRWEKIAADVPGKTLEEIKHHYKLLVEDVNQIESGCVPLPSYNYPSEGSASHASDEGAGKKGGSSWNSNNESSHGNKASKSDQERRKGIAWTEDEHRLVSLCLFRKPIYSSIRHAQSLSFLHKGWHATIICGLRTLNTAMRGVICQSCNSVQRSCSLRCKLYSFNAFFPLAKNESSMLFLLGLEKYGKGDWRSISRNFVVTRTPTQVASHAQKYFIRLNSMNKDRRRSSIHDITSVNNGDVSAPQGPITGQTNGSAANSGKPTKPAPPTPSAAPSVGIYAAPTIGQPIGGPLVSAVGTPVNLPAPAHMAYGLGAPVPGTVVPGAPMNLGPVPYPMPHTSAHR
ncbi:hypothetical protein V8G54_005108 [Vigna mungo]|uniref:Transcription factor SRM1 n=1 Tax=Vigna mungo TaxID=3915 RepID=A0AAQ3PHZ5_VIGMU